MGDGKRLRAAFAQMESPQLRLFAAAALAKAGQADALEWLRKQLQSDDRAVRNTTAYVLARLGGEPDIAAVASTLEREKDVMARAILVSALACLGQSKGREELGRNLDSADAAVPLYRAFVQRQ